MPTLANGSGALRINVPRGSSLIIRNQSGVETVTGSSVAREDATYALGSGAFVYGPQTASSDLSISTTGVLTYDIVAGDPTPASTPAQVTRNASTGSPTGLIDPATGQPLGGGGGSVVERFARKVLALRGEGIDPQLQELASLPPVWSAGQYKRGKVIANAAQTLFWIASNDGVAPSAAEPTMTAPVLTPDNAHNWQFVSPIGPERLTRKPSLFDVAGNRIVCQYLRTSSQGNNNLDAAFVAQFGAASGYDRFTNSTPIRVNTLYAQTGAWNQDLQQFFAYAAGNWGRTTFSDVALSFYTDSPRIGMHSSWDQRGRLNVDGVDLVFSEEIDPPTGDGAFGYQRGVWRDLNFGWSTVRKIELNGSGNLGAIVIQKGYRIWPANDIGKLRGAYYGDSTAAGGGPSPIRANDQWQASAMRYLTGAPSAIRYATGGVGYARGSDGQIMNLNSDTLFSRTLYQPNQDLIDVSKGATPLDYVWFDQTGWDMPGIDSTYPTMQQFEDAFSLVLNVWLVGQPQAVIIVSTYRGDNLTNANLADPYVARMKDICNRLIPKDRLILIDPYGKQPMPYITKGVGGYSSNQQVFYGQGNGNYYIDGAHPSQAYTWLKAREAAHDIWFECQKVINGIDRGYGRA